MSNTNIIAVLQSQLREIRKDSNFFLNRGEIYKTAYETLLRENQELREDNEFLRRNNELLLKELKG